MNAKAGTGEAQALQAASVCKAVTEAFGLHPEDVVAPIKNASDVCGWLEELFKAIRKEAEKKDPDQFKVRTFAEMGAHLAMDFGNYYDSQHEDMFAKLKAAGQIPADLVRRPELSAFGVG